MKNVSRRNFLKETAVFSAGIAGYMGGSSLNSRPAVQTAGILPVRKIGKHDVSRLIIGGNPFSFIAHSEPIIYSQELFKHYFTHDKVVEILLLCVKNGINTFLGRIDDNTIAFLKLYEETAGRRIPWIAQTSKKPFQGASKEDILENIKVAADNGAIGIYLQGQSSDYLVKEGRIREIEEYLAFIRKMGLIAGIGAHEIGTVEACDGARLEPEFYMKTFNSLEYNCPDFARTKEYMSSVRIPWIAFKVLAAGRMTPEKGFADAIETGADFLCVGMFDFQVERNVKLAAKLFGGA